jgi:methylmalonyl-CoA/ethylmalonyl-CoA epimerase
VADALEPWASRPPDQIGFVTNDLERTVEALRATWGEQDWSVHGYSGAVLAWRTYRGEPGQFESRNAVGGGGRLGVVQPLAGPSVHTEALERRGVGPAYVSWFVEDLSGTAEQMAALGAAEVMRGGGHGLDGDGEFVYYDTVDRIGLYSQFAVRPRRRRAASGRL